MRMLKRKRCAQHCARPLLVRKLGRHASCRSLKAAPVSMQSQHSVVWPHSVPDVMFCTIFCRCSEAGEVPKFQFVEINGLRLPSPQHAYSALYEVRGRAVQACMGLSIGGPAHGSSTQSACQASSKHCAWCSQYMACCGECLWRVLWECMLASQTSKHVREASGTHLGISPPSPRPCMILTRAQAGAHRRPGGAADSSARAGGDVQR